jgi:hypothetical protein
MKPLTYSMRVVAIDLTNEGVALATLDGPRHLVDWGTHRFAKDRDDATVTAIKRHMDHYEPEALVIEDCTAFGSRKGARIRDLADLVARMGQALGAKVVRIPRRLSLRVCAGSVLASKHVLADRLVARFPDLRLSRPSKRRIWEGEDYRFNLFDAIAFGLTAYAVGGDPRRAPSRRWQEREN